MNLAALDTATSPARVDSRTARRRDGRVLAAATAVLALGAATVAILDLTTATTLDALLHVTISQVGLTSLAPIFEGAVLAIALGGAVVLAAAVRLRRDRRGRAIAGAILAAIAITGFVLVAVFTKQDWSQPPSLSGWVHRLGSLAAFLALPSAVIVLAAGAHTARRLAAGAITAALAGLASFVPLLVAVARVGLHGSWWRQVPLGLVERAIAVCDIIAFLLLAAYCLRARRGQR